MSKLYENSKKFAGDCFTSRNERFWKTGKYGSLCPSITIDNLFSVDYSHTGLCNYYTTDDEFDFSFISMAFQVWSHTKHHIKAFIANFPI